MLTPLNLAVDRETRDILRSRAEALGLSISAYLRLLAHEPDARPSAVDRLLTKKERRSKNLPQPPELRPEDAVKLEDADA